MLTQMVIYSWTLCQADNDQSCFEACTIQQMKHSVWNEDISNTKKENKYKLPEKYRHNKLIIIMVTTLNSHYFQNGKIKV